MKKFLIASSLTFILFPVFSLAESKKISCEITQGGESTPWRYDEFIFNTDDFKKDSPKATHIVVMSSSGSRTTNSINFSVNPTHIVFEEVFYTTSNAYHSISRETLERTIRFSGISKCSISDVEVSENIF